ncbi:hypothetical protein W02_20390 [Nitrospira sp. KM1]|uniref:CV_2116 domain-containing protein n=1 Tax=Nitrospira sp. KM1 TaxID=1936990 RepID=UPI0013A77ED4|nr:hypothetical protein [Nitrospira sp. KM1]BCA54899.1 hypothetical protein W02_20390 [Nitrospira sp. KM1]
MAQSIVYKYYTIESAPRQGFNQQWRPEIIIISAKGEHGTTMRHFTIEEVSYPTEAEADRHGVAYGKQIIDGKVLGVRIADPRGQVGRMLYLQYKDSEISSAPFVVRNTRPEQWRACIQIISRNNTAPSGEFIDERRFYATEHAAHEAGFEYGRYIIDGHLPAGPR